MSINLENKHNVVTSDDFLEQAGSLCAGSFPELRFPPVLLN